MSDYKKSGIVMLKRSQLNPHPDNPRKDLGDLEELRESIREHGIMQNLTVVPVPCKEGQYVILIGHRRFAASEGIIDELPCVIAEGLTAREQVGIMLMENMQRADLTVFEQAHGFQLMLDLGETIETVSEKTGFSQATVKHRLEINKLSKKAIESAAENDFQPTISDFIELERVKDIDERNKILENAESSSDIKYEVQRWVEEKQRKENMKKYLDLIKSYGWKESKEYFYTYGADPKYKEVDGLTRINLEEDYDDSNLKAAALRITVPVLYRCDGYYISFAIKNPDIPKEKKKSKEDLQKEARDKRAAELNDIRIDICDSYYKFITEIPEEKLKDLGDKSFKSIIGELFEILYEFQANFDIGTKSYGIKTKVDMKLNEDFENYDLLQKFMLLVWAELSLAYSNKFVQWNFSKDMEVLKTHQKLYKILKHFGFRLDEDRLSVIEGTSDLYDLK